MEKAFAERRRAQEDEYFHRQELSLVERMHQRATLETERQGIRLAVGIADDDGAEALRVLGYRAETVPLVYLVPLVQVAWADGGLTAREREHIETAAHGRGIEVGSGADRQLLEWLHTPPPDEFFRGTLQVVRRLLDALPAAERATKQRELLVSCYGIAAASRGLLGLAREVSKAELAVLKTIEAEFAVA